MNISKVVNQPWMVSIIGTMIGVFAAFFLNDWREAKTSREEMKKRIEKIDQELETNQSVIQKNVIELQAFYDAIVGIEDFQKVIASSEDIQLLLNRSSWLYLTDSSRLNPSTSIYALGLELNMPNDSELSDFAWNFSATSDALNHMDFECLYSLQSTYAIQGKLKSELVNLEEVTLGTRKTPSFEKFLRQKVQLILTYEKILMSLYEFHLKQSCGG